MFYVKKITEIRSDEVTILTTILNNYLSFGLATEEKLKALIKNQRVYLALDSGTDEIIGLLILQNLKEYLEITHVITLPNFRNIGVASNLLSYALSSCESLVRIKALGWVKPHGWDAEKLFLNKGFSTVKEDKDYWKKDCNSSEYCPYYTDRCNCSSKHVELIK